MNKLGASIVLCTVMASLLLAAPEEDSDVKQLRKEVRELQQMMVELKKANKELEVNSDEYFEGENNDMPSNDFYDLKTSVKQIEAALEGNAKSGFQLAGYTSFDWVDAQGSDNEFTGVKFAPIFHYQYGDLFQFEGELEFKAQDDGETETELEYAAGTLFINDYMGLQMGKFLSPIGQYVQNLHPAWINKLPSDPVGFGHDGAAPTSNIGVALRGGLPKVADLRSNYAFFVSNAPSFGEADDGDIGIDASGKTTSGDVSKTWGGRFAINPMGGMEFGVSGAIGKASEELTATTNIGAAVGDKIDRDYDVFGADFMFNINGIDLKAEYVQQEIGENELSSLEGGTWRSWYGQISYQFSSIKLEPVIRYSDYHNPETERNQWALGLNYLFANNLIAKVAYEYNENEDSAGEASINNNRVLAQFAFGF